MSTDALYRQVTSTPATVVAGEAAIVTPSDSRLHILNGVGTEIWEICEGEGATLEAIVAEMLRRFDVSEETARTEVGAFLADAVQAGILEEVGE